MDNPNKPVSSPGFEGAEKLLEIWFQPAATQVAGERKGLFQVARQTWVEMLKLVRCEVIGYISSGELDAYLLSESSMFVGEHSLVLKTCGTTTPLLALEKLLEIAKNIGLTEVDQFFYSRKSFMFPEFQKFPHTGWDDEVKFIEKEGHNFVNGSAYLIGKTNGSHWYCYIWDLGRTLKKETRQPEKRPWSSRDYTLEVLMCGLDPENSCIFSREHPKDANGRLKVTNALQALYDHVQIDDFMFDPCGYSCNGISGHHYFDVHVTPESHCSFASFETNLPPTEKMPYTKLVSDVIAIFKPSSFTVTLFAEKDEFDDEVTEHPMPPSFLGGKDGLRRQDRINYEFDHYDLAFTHYTTK